MAIFNLPYYKEHYLQNKQTVIIPGMVEVPDIPEHREYIIKLPLTPLITPPLALPTTPLPPAKPMNISMIGAAPYGMLSKRRDYYYFILSIRDIDKALEERKEVDSKTILDPEY